jgi:outer membrane protein assembly factor BamD
VLGIVMGLLLAAPVPAAAQGTGIFGIRRQPDTPESLYNKALSQMKRGYFDEAILNFEKVRNHFPFNQYSVLSELRVADCLYEKSAFLESVDAYLRFSKLHPRHPEIDYVIYRAARAEFKLSPLVAQRDQGPTKRAVRRLARFEQRFPDSTYVDSVKSLRRKALRRLSRGSLEIGNFYYKRREFGAAERRFRMVVDEYPLSPLVPKANYRRANALMKLERPAEAESLMRAIAAGEDERWARRAQRWLERFVGPAAAPPTETAASQ